MMGTTAPSSVTPAVPRRQVSPRTPPAISLFDAWEEAHDLSRHGLCVIPMIPGTKRAHIKWKPFQTQPPSGDQIDAWWRRWPDAGIAVVLGPVSGVLAIDVDGPEAHAELLRRLGGEPVAPKVLTGSGKPFRSQFLFRLPPGLATHAKITPWHPQLEFRGRGGLSVLPPSVHKSGKRYRWAPGRSLDELDLPDLPQQVLDALQTRADVDAGGGATCGPDAAAPTDRLGGVQKRALALITKSVSAVYGHGGDRATFTAACYLVRDFGLSVEQALPVIKAWNVTNCTPRWTEADLLHKLRKADELSGPRGRLVRGQERTHPVPDVNTPVPKVRLTGCVQSPAVPASPPATCTGPPFSIPIPDSVLTDWEVARPRPKPVGRGRPSTIKRGLFALVRATVVLQKSSVVRLPDVALAQLVWGGDRSRWPVRWRAELARRLADLPGMKVKTKGTCCRRGCPLHDRPDVAHRDVRFRVDPVKILSALHLFVSGHTKGKGFAYDFSGFRSRLPDAPTAKENTGLIRGLKRRGRLCSVYLPAWVFGPVVLAPGPCRVLKALTRELTRRPPGPATRADRAETVPGSVNPLLDNAKSYVGFNGNAGRKKPQFHGHGYSLGQWMKRAGCPNDPGSPSYRAAVRVFLADLRALCGPFGLVVAARVPDRAGWSTAEELLAEIDVVRPHRLARECLIRVYGPDDYPDRWRAYFAARLGLGTIPRGMPGEAVEPATGPPSAAEPIQTGEQLARWMKGAGLNDFQMAEKLGVSRTLVCKCRVGARKLSASVRAKLARVVEQFKSKKATSVTKPVSKTGAK